MLLLLFSPFVHFCNGDRSLGTSFAIEKAMCPMTTTKIRPTRKTLSTLGHYVWTTWMETTASRWRDQARNFATSWQFRQASAVWSKAFRIWSSREEQLRIGMLRSLNHFLAWSTFNRLSCIHHQCILSKIARTGNVMRDKEQSKLLFILQTQQDVQNIQTD